MYYGLHLNFLVEFARYLYRKGEILIIISILLILVGITALILAAVLPVVGIPGIIGGIAALLAGIGFFIFYCNCCRSSQSRCD